MRAILLALLVAAPAMARKVDRPVPAPLVERHPEVSAAVAASDAASRIHEVNRHRPVHKK